MGNIFSSKTPQQKILVIGLDASGKTTMLYHLNALELQNTIPVVGYPIQTARYNNLDIASWDSSADIRIDSLKKQFLNDISGVVYFVDSNDRDRIEESVEELNRELSLVEREQVTAERVPVLIFANKMDLSNAMSQEEIRDKFNKPFMIGHAWYVQSSCAVRGDGLYEGLDWLTKEIKRGSRPVTAACDINYN